MTFYNIIFGILFLGAVGQFFHIVFESSNFNFMTLPSFWMVTTLTLVVFNDVIYTTQVLEGPPTDKRKDYTLSMKLLDLLSFMFLCAALLVLAPSDNILSVKIKTDLLQESREFFFWLLLTVYWATAIIWNTAGKVYSDSSSGKIRWMLIVMLILSGFLSLANFFHFPGSIVWILRVFILLYMCSYFLLYKYFVFRKV